MWVAAEIFGYGTKRYWLLNLYIYHIWDSRWKTLVRKLDCYHGEIIAKLIGKSRLLGWAVRPLLNTAVARAQAYLTPAYTDGLILTHEQWAPFCRWFLANLVHETGFDLAKSMEHVPYQYDRIVKIIDTLECFEDISPSVLLDYLTQLQGLIRWATMRA